jgi:lipopolysaccharide biosynthesis glycosyltransferase
MKIVFCADNGMLAALHVSAKSVLDHFQGEPSFTVLSDELGEDDMGLLHKTLAATGKNFQLNLLRVDSKPFQDFPSLAGRHSTYFRLLIPDLIAENRCLYLDCDILCCTDVSPLGKWDLGGRALGLAPEAPIRQSIDRKLVAHLGPDASGFYYNAGVCVMDCARWRKENLARKCLDYIATNRPDYHDQSALNFIFHNEIAGLDISLNRHTNVRANWPHFRSPNAMSGQLLHFVDFPKPWSRFARWVHPLGKMWWHAYRQTAYSQTGAEVISVVKWSQKIQVGYKKAFKDRILFSLYCSGLILPKGVPEEKK